MPSSQNLGARALPTSARVSDEVNEEANALQALGHACEEGDTSKPHGSRTGGLREPGHAHGYRLSSQDGVDRAGRDPSIFNPKPSFHTPPRFSLYHKRRSLGLGGH